MIFVISDRSICLKLTIRFLRLNFCQVWKLLKSLKNHCTDSWRKQRSQNYFSQKKTKHILFCRNDQNSKKEDVEEHCKTASDFWFLNISSCEDSKCIKKYFKILEKRIICVVRPRFQDRFWCFKRRYFYHILPIRPNMTIEDAHGRTPLWIYWSSINQEVKHRMGPILFGAQHERRERGWWRKGWDCNAIYYCYKYTLMRPCVALWTMVVVLVIQ